MFIYVHQLTLTYLHDVYCMTVQIISELTSLCMVPSSISIYTAPEEATLTYEPLDLTMQSTELNGDHHDLEPSTIFTNNHEVCTSRDDTYEPLLLRILSDIDEAATAAGAGANGDIYEPMELRTLQLRKDTMYTVPSQVGIVCVCACTHTHTRRLQARTHTHTITITDTHISDSTVLAQPMYVGSLLYMHFISFVYAQLWYCLHIMHYNG